MPVLPSVSSTARTRAPLRTSVEGVLDLGGEVPVRAGPLDVAAQQRDRRGRWPATGCSGPRRSRARAAVRYSTATTRASPSTERRSLRAADQPIETWSSCIALLGIESTLAGFASRFSSETIAAWVYCAIMWPESTPGSWARNGGSPWLRVRSRNRSVRRSRDRRHVGRDDRQEVEHVGDRRPVEVAVGLDPAVVEHDRVVDGRGQLARRRPARRGRRCRGRRRAPAASSAASRRPAPGCSPGRGGWRRSPEPASSRVRFAAEAACPGCGRSACRSAANTRSVASWPSTLIAAVMSAALSSIRRSAIAITSMPSIPSVPLISARPSLASSSTGVEPGLGERDGGGTTYAVRGR